MPIYIKHNKVWLRVKDVQLIKSSQSHRGGVARGYSMVAESYSTVKLNGYKYSARLKVPFSKVSRFAIRTFLAMRGGEIDDNIVVLIEEDSSSKEDYEAIVYAKNKKTLEKNVEKLMHILSELRTRRKKKEEEVAEEEEGEEEEEEE